MQKTLGELAKIINAELKGDPECIISSIATLQSATTNQISFLDNPKYRKYLSATKASAVILSEQNLDACPCNALILKNPYFGYAMIARVFAKQVNVSEGIHPTVVIGNNCQIDPTAKIAAKVVIGNDVVIGANTQIGPNCVVSDRVTIGENCRLWGEVVLYHDTQMGNHVEIHSGTVIGVHGFGFAYHQGAWHHVPQLGRVVIHDHVNIGARTVIERGAIGDTMIEEGVILDNQVQIAHNDQIGENTAIAGCTAIAGSTSVGKNCILGGGVGVAGHIKVTDNVMVTGMGMITKSIKEPGVYSSGTGFMKTKEWKQLVVNFSQLDEIARRILRLENL